MIKKVRVEQLKPGMFIHDLNCSWLHHPFLRNKVKINNEQVIKKIISCGIREVYIDTNKGLDITNTLTEEKINQEVQNEFTRMIESKVNIRDTVSIQEELVKAKEIKKEALQTVQNLMEDIKFGRQIRMEKVNRIVERMIESIFRNKDALTSLNRIKKIDEYTFLHSVSVGALMITFGRHLGFDYQLIKELGIGGLLHDIGKIKVPLEILTKADKLTEEEFTRAKEHVKYGQIILEQTPGIYEASIYVVIQHHERLDGRGYPDRLKKEEISRYGQMAAIVDVYDAMTSKRCYQKQFHPTETLRKLYEWNNLYNRELVQQFIRCVGIYPVGTLVRLESGLLGVVLNHGEKSLLHPVIRIIYDTKKERYITPRKIELSEYSEDRIVCYEPPEKWKINPEVYLSE
jgi:putative nucleotidyltransferase with HDIG domain